MSGWIVYSKDGSLERCKLRSLEYGGTAMGERAVTATFDFHSEVAFEVFDYIEYRGERFELEAVPTVKKLSSFEYQYELRFVSLKYELERCEMRDLVPSDNGVVYPTPLTFSFTGDVRYLTDRIQACLDAMYGAGVWKITIAEGTSSEEKNITMAQQNCWNALALVNSTYGLNFYIKGRTITIGGEQPLVSHTFEYGKGNGLYEIERASDTETGIVTKLRAYGSTRNLDYSYPKKPEWSDSVLPVSFALSPLRLMLPSFKTDGKTDYVLADNAAIAKYGIREASMVYDDIYPSIAGATYNGQAIDEIKAVDSVDESQKNFVVYLHDLGFDLEEHLTTSDAQISMKSGTLQGYTFTISAIEKQTGGYKITLGRNSLENSEESGAYVPNANWNMKAGDKFVLLNILMPQKYIRDAEERLLARAKEYLAQYAKTNFSYNIGLHDKFLIQNTSVYESLIEGSKLKVYDKEIGIDEEVTIQSITITENLEDNLLPQVKVTLNNEPSASTLDRIQGKLDEVAAETAANGFTTQSEIMAQYRKKLDKPFFDKLFVAIDANGNEIPSTDVITPIAYIKAKYHVASVGGFTMYAMDKDVNIPSLASGLPFDGRTIWYNPDTQQIEVIGGTGGGSGEGVSNFWDLSGIPSWITNSKPKYSYSEIEGTPDLTKYALVSQIPSLSGYATESWVNQQNYAIKATTLSGYGITDAYTKTNVDDLLKSYVTLGGTQTITGEKNFVGGLKVNGSPIYYDTEKKYWKLEGDLLVTGGVTMYGSDSSFTPSTIMDAIAVDGTTISKSGGVLKVIGGTGGGVADSVAWANITGKPTWIGSSKPSYSYSEITGAISTTELQNYLTSNSYLNVTSGDNRYLQLSGGTLASSGNPLSIKRTDGNGPGLVFYSENAQLGSIGISTDYVPKFYNANVGLLYTIWHSGNDGSGSGLDADSLDGYHANSSGNKSWGTIPVVNSSGWMEVGKQLEFHYDNTTNSDYSTLLKCTGNYSNVVDLPSSSGTIALTTDNVSSATKLQTARTIWGQTFDGSGNIDGDITITSGSTIKLDSKRELISFSNNYFVLGYGNCPDGVSTYLDGYDIRFRTGSSWNTSMLIDGYGNIGIGTTSPSYTLDVSGTCRASISVTSNMFFTNGEYGIWKGSSFTAGLSANDLVYYAEKNVFYGNVGMGTTNPSAKLEIESSKFYGLQINSKDSSVNRSAMVFRKDGVNKAQFGWDALSSMGVFMYSYPSSFYLGIKDDGSLVFGKSSINFSVDSSGNGLFYGGVTMYSMRALKNVVDERGLSLNELSTIKPTRYTWKDGRDNRLHFGGIADDIQQVLPEVVYKTSDGILTMDYGNAAFAVASSLIKPVIDHEKRIAMLEKENKELRNEVERLKSA